MRTARTTLGWALAAAGILGLPASVLAAPKVITATSAAGLEPPGAVALAELISETLSIDDFEVEGKATELFGLGPAPFSGLTLPASVCAGDPMSTAELRARVEEVQSLTDALELDAAGQQVDAARQSLACLTDAVDTELLYDLYFAEGVVGFYLGDEARAEEAFERAVGAARRAWNQSYPPSLGQLYVTIKDRLTDLPRTSLRPVRATPEGRYLVNGQPVEDAALAPGQHLLQQEGADGTWTTVLVEISPEDAGLSYPILDPTAGALALVSGPLTPETSADVAAILGLRARANGWEEMVLVTMESVVSFDVASGSFTGAHQLEPPRADTDNGGSRAATGIPLIVAGSATLGGGLALNMATYQAGQVGDLSDERYAGLRGANIASAPVMAAGAGLAIAGIILVVTQQRGAGGAEAATPRALPTLAWTGDGVQLGVVGVLP